MLELPLLQMLEVLEPIAMVAPQPLPSKDRHLSDDPLVHQLSSEMGHLTDLLYKTLRRNRTLWDNGPING